MLNTPVFSRLLYVTVLVATLFGASGCEMQSSFENPFKAIEQQVVGHAKSALVNFNCLPELQLQAKIDSV